MKRDQPVRRQQTGGGAMIRAGIVDNKLIGQVNDCVKITFGPYCEIPKTELFPCIDDLPLYHCLKLVFM